MNRYQWDFAAALSHPEFWLKGLGISLLYAGGTIFFGILIGIISGIALLSPSRIIRFVVDFYVQIFRCTPLLVQVVWFYYALPILLNVNLPAWLAAGLGLTLYMGAFCAEIFRAGIMSIEKGQWQAAKALGMRSTQLMRRIILPQAARRMIPPVMNQSVLQLKNTSLLSVIAVPDLMYVGTTIVSETYRPLEVYTVLAGIYFIVLYPLQKLSKLLESRDDL